MDSFKIGWPLHGQMMMVMTKPMNMHRRDFSIYLDMQPDKPNSIQQHLPGFCLVPKTLIKQSSPGLFFKRIYLSFNWRCAKIPDNMQMPKCFIFTSGAFQLKYEQNDRNGIEILLYYTFSFIGVCSSVEICFTKMRQLSVHIAAQIKWIYRLI